MRIGHTHGAGHSWEFLLFLLLLVVAVAIFVVIKNVFDNE